MEVKGTKLDSTPTRSRKCCPGPLILLGALDFTRESAILLWSVCRQRNSDSTLSRLWALDSIRESAEQQFYSGDSATAILLGRGSYIDGIDDQS